MPTLVLDGLRLWAAAHPGHRLLAAVDPRGVVAASLTAAQLLARAEAMAAGLRAAGVAPGDAVMLVISPDSPLARGGRAVASAKHRPRLTPPHLAPPQHFAVAFWGCLLARVAAVPFAPPPPWLPLLPRGAGVAAAGARRGAAALAALERAAARAGATTALSDGPLRAALLPLRLRAAAARLGAAATGGGSGGAAAPPPLTWMDAALVEASGQRRLRGDGAVGWREPPPGAGDVALLQCSSGSTGDPKPIVVTHGNLAHNCGLQRAALGVDAGCVQLSWCPLWVRARGTGMWRES